MGLVPVDSWKINQKLAVGKEKMGKESIKIDVHCVRFQEYRVSVLGRLDQTFLIWGERKKRESERESYLGHINTTNTRRKIKERKTSGTFWRSLFFFLSLSFCLSEVCFKCRQKKKVCRGRIRSRLGCICSFLWPTENDPIFFGWFWTLLKDLPDSGGKQGRSAGKYAWHVSLFLFLFWLSLWGRASTQSRHRLGGDMRKRVMAERKRGRCRVWRGGRWVVCRLDVYVFGHNMSIYWTMNTTHIEREKKKRDVLCSTWRYIRSYESLFAWMRERTKEGKRENVHALAEPWFFNKQNLQVRSLGLTKHQKVNAQGWVERWERGGWRAFT